jgi:hypothetical protein
LEETVMPVEFLGIAATNDGSEITRSRERGGRR